MKQKWHLKSLYKQYDEILTLDTLTVSTFKVYVQGLNILHHMVKSTAFQQSYSHKLPNK